MAESDSTEDRTEEPTQRRLAKAREDGQIARSRELNTTFILIGGVGGLIALGPELGAALADLMRSSFVIDRAVVYDPSALLGQLVAGSDHVLRAFMPLFLLLLVAALAGPLALGGALFSSKAIKPQGSRLNPLKGLKRMFSMNALIELAKTLAKFGVVGSIALISLLALERPLLQLGVMALHPALAQAVTLSAWTVFGVSCGLIVIAILDVPYQLHAHRKKLRMTRQEIKDEFKDTEGRPEVKSRLRQLQRELAHRRMMDAVPQADVVITNPEHFAVALRYRAEQDRAPVVVAKGTDLTAFRIRDVARAHQVVELPAPLLARAIYYTTELEQAIPAGLYVAVAQVLAYVFELKAHRRGQAEAPRIPDTLPIPEHWQFDAQGRPLQGEHD